MPRKFNGLKLDAEEVSKDEDDDSITESAWDDENRFTKDGLVVDDTGKNFLNFDCNSVFLLNYLKL